MAQLDKENGFFSNLAAAIELFAQCASAAKPFFNDQPMLGEIEMRLTKQKKESKGSNFGQ